MEKETKHTPETLWEKMAREDWLAGEGFSGKFDGLSRVPHIFKPRIFEFAESYSASLQTELSEMKAAYEKDANKLMAERDYFKNLCEEKDKVIEDYSCNLKPVNELKAEIEKHMRELSEMKKEVDRLKKENKVIFGSEMVQLSDYQDLKKEREELMNACETVVKGYEGDGMENMYMRDEVFYKTCKDVLSRISSKK